MQCEFILKQFEQNAGYSLKLSEFKSAMISGTGTDDLNPLYLPVSTREALRSPEREESRF